MCFSKLFGIIRVQRKGDSQVVRLKSKQEWDHDKSLSPVSNSELLKGLNQKCSQFAVSLAAV